MLALLPSPLLGPAVWDRIVPALAGRGWEVLAPPAVVSTTRDPHSVLDAYVDALPADRDIVLIPHSNAGLFVPLIAQMRSVVGWVFLDARLPPTAGSVGLAPPHLLTWLAEKADGAGMLPPWTTWWDPADRDALFPDHEVMAAVERQQIRLPLSYFAEVLHMPAGWDDKPSAYLAFGDTYAEEHADAAARGWKVDAVPGHHLHMLIDPEGVAAALEGLLDQIGFAPEPAADRRW